MLQKPIRTGKYYRALKVLPATPVDTKRLPSGPVRPWFSPGLASLKEVFNPGRVRFVEDDYFEKKSRKGKREVIDLWLAHLP